MRRRNVTKTKPQLKMKVFGTLSGAHRSKRSFDAHKTHACEVNEDGAPIRPVCGRVQLDSIAPYPDEHEGEQPTCPVCLRRWNSATQ